MCEHCATNDSRNLMSYSQVLHNWLMGNNIISNTTEAKHTTTVMFALSDNPTVRERDLWHDMMQSSDLSQFHIRQYNWYNCNQSTQRERGIQAALRASVDRLQQPVIVEPIDDTIDDEAEPIRCEQCDCELDADDADQYMHNDDHYCESCFYEYYCDCDNCGQTVSTDDVTLVNDSCVCDSCLDRNYARCDDCREWLPDSETTSIGHGDRCVCESCLSDNYGSCESCGDYCASDDMRGAYCSDCQPDAFDLELYSAGNYSHVLDYDAKAEWAFIKQPWENTLYLGIELEIEFGEDNARGSDVFKHTKKYLENRFILKYDGSLNNGCELVVTPHTLQSLKKIDWRGYLQGLKDLGCKSYDGGTCGLHVHLSDNSLATHSALRNFFVKNKDQLIKFSARDLSSLTRWCDIPTDNNSWKHDRYTAVNFTGATNELRLFRGTLDYNRFRATLDFCDAVVCFLESKKHDDTWAGFCDWLETQKTYTVLKKHLKNKDLTTTKEK